MSLLMDALRKAEEAKRKAADRHKGKELPEEGPPAGEVIENKYSQTSVSPSREASPTLTETGKTAPSRENSPEAVTGDRALNEVQEYFSQKTRQSSQRKIQARETHGQNVSGQAEAPLSAARETRPAQESAQPLTAAAPLASSAPVAEEHTSDGYSRYQDLRRTRESAGAVFAAKQQSQGRRKAYMFATVVLGLPILATAFWFYRSYSEATSSFIQQGTAVAPGRGFLGEELETAPRQLPPSETTVTNPLLDAGLQAGTTAGDRADPPEAAITIGVVEENPESPDSPEPVREAPVFALEQNAPTDTQEQPEPLDTASQSTQASEEQAQGYNLQLVRNTRPVQQSQTLQDAFNHLQLGNSAQARQLYQNVLAGAPNNRDALLGMAALFRQENETASAQRLYSRLLQLNPRDAMARAGLIEATLSAGSPSAAEEELLALISANATSAPLHFALGNLYASQKRWSEAESAYFEALGYARSETPDSISPDYAFNLAVSLEQLNQLPLAYQYYQQAAAAARVSAAGFEPEVLNRRLLYLEEHLK